MARTAMVTTFRCGVLWLMASGACTADAWYFQTVDWTGNVGMYTSLALDASGYPHISYLDATNSDLKYAAWNGSGWDMRTVDSAGRVGWHTSLALDASGYPHISYQDLSNGDLKYAAWNGSSWDIQTVDSGSVGWYTSLALDANRYPHISYFDWTNYDLNYAAWNGSSWDIQTVDSAGNVGEYTSLALDASSGYPRISYFDRTNTALKYAAWTGSSWDIETVDTAGEVGYSTSLALNASGYPRISYFDDSNRDLKYAAWHGSGWDIQTVDSAGDVGWYTSLALDASGNAHISYYDYLNEDLKYAAWNGSTWDIQTVDSVPWGVGRFTSLALDASGYAHISYYDAFHDDLKYATTQPMPPHLLPATGYYMISLPLTPTLPTPHDVLSDDLGDGNYYMWRWRWEAGGYQTIPTSLPGSQTTPLSAQQGYWLLAQAATLDIDVGGTLPHGGQAILLQTGWNMVAAPYEATMDSLQVDNWFEVKTLADAEIAGWVLGTFYYSHDGTGSYSTLTIGQTPADALSLWYGYWVLAGVDCSLIVPPPSGGAGGTAIRAAQPAQAQPAWAFDVRASSGSSTDSVTIGAADAASNDFDGFPLDKPKPPSPPAEGRLRMVLKPDAAVIAQVPAASELAMETKSSAAQADWEFTATGGVQGEPVRLAWPSLSQLPKDRVAMLTDQDTGKRTLMRSRAQYEFAAPGDGGARSFTVTVKPAQEGTLLMSGLTAMPTRGGAWDIGFNLSADASVIARVYNVAGRLVADLARAQRLPRGRASLAWNGRTLTDTNVPSGTYLLRLTARTEAGEQASAVTMLQVGR